MNEKTECAAAVLVKSLVRLSAVYEQRSPAASAGHVLLEARDGKLQLYCTDYKISAETELESVGDMSQVLLPGKKLLELARSFGQNRVSIERTDSGAVLKCLRARIVLPALPANDFKRAIPPAAAGAAVSSAELVAALEAVLPAVSSDETTRAAMCGVRFLMDGADVVAVATDGGRMVLAGMTAAGALGGAFTVPRGGVAELIKAFSGPDCPVTISSHDRFALFVSESTKIACSLAADEFPDFRRVLDLAFAGSLAYELPRQELLAAVKRVALVLDEQQRAVCIKLSAELCLVSAPKSCLASAEEEVAVASGCAATMSFSLNSRFLADALSVFESDQICLASVAEGRPVVISYAEAPKFKALIMPLRQ